MSQPDHGCDEVAIIRGREYISVSLWKRGVDTRLSPNALAEASLVILEDGKALWYVNRVLVRDVCDRRSRYGSIVLRHLLSEVSNTDTPVAWVTPGGYTYETVGQVRFYEYNGFEMKSHHSGVVWEWIKGRYGDKETQNRNRKLS